MGAGDHETMAACEYSTVQELYSTGNQTGAPLRHGNMLYSNCYLWQTSERNDILVYFSSSQQSARHVSHNQR